MDPLAMIKTAARSWSPTRRGASSRRARSYPRSAVIPVQHAVDAEPSPSRPILQAEWELDPDGRLVCRWRIVG
jgi:hypothetical protein